MVQKLNGTKKGQDFQLCEFSCPAVVSLSSVVVKLPVTVKGN